MITRLNIQLLLLLCIVTVTIHAQEEDQPPSLNLGDPAPPLQVREWIKGTPVQRFEKGRVYVVEFWATWCKPCIAEMPHLSALAREYKDKVTIIGIDVKELKNSTMKKVRAFVDSMGQKMDYTVATEDSNFMVAGWMDASATQGIPATFVVNGEGRLAWIGHPMNLDEVLRKIVNNTWNVNEALAERNEKRHLEKLDYEASYALMEYLPGQFRPGYRGNPDSLLLAIDEIVRKEPKLKYAPYIASYTFSSLLKTNPQKAYEYGKSAIITPSYEDPPYNIIINRIELHSDTLNLPPEIYELGAEAYQAKIDKYARFGNMDIPNNYNKMAVMYWRAKNKSKAIETQQKAIEALKREKNTSKKEMAAFELKLEQYKNM